MVMVCKPAEAFWKSNAHQHKLTTSSIQVSLLEITAMKSNFLLSFPVHSLMTTAGSAAVSRLAKHDHCAWAFFKARDCFITFRFEV
jgi:hypothetical protein